MAKSTLVWVSIAYIVAVGGIVAGIGFIYPLRVMLVSVPEGPLVIGVIAMLAAALGVRAPFIALGFAGFMAAVCWASIVTTTDAIGHTAALTSTLLIAPPAALPGILKLFTLASQHRVPLGA